MTILLTPEEEEDDPTVLADDDDDFDFFDGGQLPVAEKEEDSPRNIRQQLPMVDRIFRSTVKVIGTFVLILTGAIGLFLGYQAFPTFEHYGWGFLTGDKWDPSKDVLGIAGAIVGTVEVAAVALLIGVPLALLAALFTSEYCPRRIKPVMVAIIDLMAAVPSVIYGVWALFVLQTPEIDLARWINQNFGFIPFFKTDADPNAAATSVWGRSYYGSVFIAGAIVGIMIVPTACAVMRGVFDLAPIGEREAAYALGSTRWGMIRSVVLPFGRGGIVGGTMLALGRALGETVAVLLVITVVSDVKFRILSEGTLTISSRIANSFGESSGIQLKALLAAGFILFCMTLVVNTFAAVIVSRSRSGAGTDA